MAEDWKRRTLDSPRGFWSTVTLFMAVGVFLPLMSLRKESFGDVKLSLGVSAAAFALGAIRLTFKALDRYEGPEANVRIWRAIGLLALAGAPTLAAFFYIFDESDPPALAVAAWISSGLSVAQLAAIFTVGLMVPDKKQFPEPG